MSLNSTQKYLCYQAAPQPVNTTPYCPSCCKSYGIIFVRRAQCKCCQRYFCSNCIDNRTRYCWICEKHLNSQKGCIGVLGTYFNDGNDQAKIRAFNEFLMYWSDSLYTIEDLIKGGMIPALMNILKFKEFHLTLLEIIIFAIKKDIHVRNMIDGNAFNELAKFTEYHRKIMFLLGSIVVSCMKGSKEGEYQTIGEIIEVFEKAHEFVENENYQLKEFRKEFTESKENKEGEFIERILTQFASEEMLKLLNTLYCESVEEKRIVEVMYRFFACSIESTKCKISDSVWKETIQIIDSHNAQSIIIILIAYSKTNKTIAPYLNGGLLPKLEMLLDRQNKENTNAIIEIILIFKSFPTLFSQLSMNDDFLEIVFKTIKQEDDSNFTATIILKDIIESGDSSKYHLSEMLIENHPDLIELLISNTVKQKKIIGLKLCKVLLNTFGDEASIVLLSRGIIDGIISLSRIDDKLMVKCYKILRIAAQYHREIVSHYIETSFICTLFVNLKTNPLQSIIAINEFIQYENVQDEIIHSPENINIVLNLLKQNDIKILHETLILLNILFKNPIIFSSISIPLLPLLLPLFKILPIQSFAILLQVISTIIPHITISEKDALTFVSSSILFINQQTYEPLLQNVYTTFSIAVKAPPIRNILIYGSSNDIESNGYFSFLVCSVNKETSLTLKASQLQFFTQFIIKGDDHSTMALDILQPLLLLISSSKMISTCNSFILESLNYLCAVLSLENVESTNLIYKSNVLKNYFEMAFNWKATQVDLMNQLIVLITSFYSQVKSLIIEYSEISILLPKFLTFSALPIESVNKCLYLFTQFKLLNIPIVLTPSCIHLLLLALKDKNVNEVKDYPNYILTIPNATEQLQNEIDLLLHSHIPSLRSLGFKIAQGLCNEKMVDGLMTLTWEFITSDDINNIIKTLCYWRNEKIIHQHHLLISMIRFISENKDLIYVETVGLLFQFLTNIPYTIYHSIILKNHFKSIDQYTSQFIISLPPSSLRLDAEWLLNNIASHQMDNWTISVAVHLLSDSFIESFLIEQPQLVLQFVDLLPNSLPILLHCSSPALQPLLLLTVDFHELIQHQSSALSLLVPSTWYSKDFINDALIILKNTRSNDDINNVLYFINSIIGQKELIQHDRELLMKITKEFIDILEGLNEQIKNIQLIGNVIIKLVTELKEIRNQYQMDILFEEAVNKNNYALLEIVIQLIKMGMNFTITSHIKLIQEKLIEIPQLIEIVTMYFIQIRKLIPSDCIIKTIQLCAKNKIMKNQIIMLLLNCVHCNEWRTFITQMIQSNIFVGFIDETPLYTTIQSML
ncbi:hypothetical protein KM1_020820 [Entamoeba histolytica HM-3:IMSS]|uniref:FYVE-type domain-containing protein n=1 Tax=Entamoeba histolytica HM-3:IMSS TaxID=885315 RepID=M7XBR7_ENTHI|nr:hypothetical protein KM1_020820 [Entamoeba histolytica HM-3:IMSS]